MKIIYGGEPLKTAKAAMVMLHGRGADAEDIMSISKYFDAEKIAYVALQAPGNAWYPSSFMQPIERNEIQLKESLDIVRQAVELIEKESVRASRIFLFGFSQGACLAVQYAATHPKKYAGIFSIAGGLIGETPGTFSGDFGGTRVFFGCAEHDPYIPKKRVEESAVIFQKIGAIVTTKIYPGDAHTINDDEIEIVNEIVKKIVG